LSIVRDLAFLSGDTHQPRRRRETPAGGRDYAPRGLRPKPSWSAEFFEGHIRPKQIGKISDGNFPSDDHEVPRYRQFRPGRASLSGLRNATFFFSRERRRSRRVAAAEYGPGRRGRKIRPPPRISLGRDFPQPLAKSLWTDLGQGPAVKASHGQNKIRGVLRVFQGIPLKIMDVRRNCFIELDGIGDSRDAILKSRPGVL